MQSSVPGHFASPAFGLSGVGPTTGNRFHREAIRKVVHPYGTGRGGPMDLQCPNCRCTDLKKVSLVYQEGLHSVSTRTRLRGVVVGSDGPDLVVGRATTKGTHQTEISKVLAPPTKWSYLKLIGWAVLVFLSVGWIVFYVNTLVKNSSSVSSVSLTIYTVLSAGVFVICVLAYWKHNYYSYAREFAAWDRSFICQRCGTISDQN
jgi:hypothetical protein